jgi:hypothetical protein
MEKTVITPAEFEKRVEIEAQNLMYFEYMKKQESFAKARQTVAEKYTTQ